MFGFQWMVSGVVMYAIMRRMGLIYDGTQWVPFRPEDWQKYAIRLVEEVPTGWQAGMLPPGVREPGEYTFVAYIQAGEVPAITDSAVKDFPYRIEAERHSYDMRYHYPDTRDMPEPPVVAAREEVETIDPHSPYGPVKGPHGLSAPIPPPARFNIANVREGAQFQVSVTMRRDEETIKTPEQIASAGYLRIVNRRGDKSPMLGDVLGRVGLELDTVNDGAFRVAIPARYVKYGEYDVTLFEPVAEGFREHGGLTINVT